MPHAAVLWLGRLLATGAPPLPAGGSRAMRLQRSRLRVLLYMLLLLCMLLLCLLMVLLLVLGLHLGLHHHRLRRRHHEGHRSGRLEGATAGSRRRKAARPLCWDGPSGRHDWQRRSRLVGSAAFSRLHGHR